MENKNQMVEAFNKAIADSGIKIELWRDFTTEKWKAKIDTSVHDKQIRAEAIEKFAKWEDANNINYHEYSNPDDTVRIYLEELKEQKE